MSSLPEISYTDFFVTTFQENYIDGSEEERVRVILNGLQSKVLLQISKSRDEHGTAKLHEQ